jgi:RHS repeat-associated protein
MVLLGALSVCLFPASAKETEVYFPDPYNDTTITTYSKSSGTNSQLTYAAPTGDDDNTSELFTIQERNKVTMRNAGSILGDSIDPNSGTLNFQQTDVSIPGNFSLPVKVSRQFPSGNSPLLQFKDWALDVPYISGRLGHIWHNNRCSKMLPEETNVSFTAIHFFAGLTLNDGAGYSGLILEPDSTTIPFEIPEGYTRVTKDSWAIKCTNLLDGSEGFEALSPQGVKYVFDHQVSRPYAPAKHNGNIRTTKMHGLMATKVTDRFGNTVNYAYEGDRLTKISASDGREIVIDYPDDLSAYISSVTSNSREWQYNYTDLKPNELVSVTRPDNKKWEFNLHLLAIYTPIPGEEGRKFNIDLTHPDGVKGTYQMEEIVRFKPGMQVNIPAGKSATDTQLVENIAVASKTLNQAGISYLWSYDYGDSHWGIWEGGVNSPIETHTTTITGPETIEELTYHRYADWKEGQLLKKVTKEKDIAKTILQTVTKTWRYGNGYIGSLDLVWGDLTGVNQAKTGQIPNQDTNIIVENGSSYTTHYEDYNVYGVLEHSWEENSFSAEKKYSRYGYQHDVENGLLNLPTTTELSSDDSNYTTISEIEYYLSTHGFYPNLPKYAKKFGAWVKEYKTYDKGNVTKVEYNEPLTSGNGNRYVRYSGYKRGQPTELFLSSRYSSTEIQASRIVDDNGWVTSITDLNGNTAGYGYDELGRLLYIDVNNDADISVLPTDEPKWLDTRFIWSDAYALTLTRTTQKCTLNADKSACNDIPKFTSIETFDGLLRPVLTEHKDMVNNVSRYQNQSFDVNGNSTFTSYWSTTNTESAGMSNVYDALQRLKTTSQTGGGTSTTQYLSGNRIKFTYPNNNITTTTYKAYGEPSYANMLSVSSEENVTTSQVINLFGEVKSVTQTGPGKDGVGTVSQTEYRAYDDNHNLCKVVRNDVGTTIFTNNILGEVLTQAQGVSSNSNTSCEATSIPTGALIELVYDNMGDRHTIDYSDPNSPDITYTLDANGNLKNLTAGTVSHSYTYNSLNLLTNENLVLPGKTMTLGYGYNDLGYVASITYPDGDQVTAAPNAFGQPTQAARLARTGREAFTYAISATYYPTGSINTFYYGADDQGLQHKTTLNDRKVPERIKDAKAGFTALEYSYTYDDNLNVKTLTDHVNSNFSITGFSYDGLDRLTSTTGDNGMGSSSIKYDGLGNITEYKNEGHAISGKNRSLDYFYDTNNRLDIVQIPGTTPLKIRDMAYDDRGNVTDNYMLGFTYNLANQMVSASGGNKTFLYDGHNRRVKKTSVTNGVTNTNYSLYSQAGTLLYRETPTGGINYIYLGKKLIAKDGVIPENGGKQHYRPFGESIEGAKDDVGYTGHKFDTDLGLSYMQARYYDPVIGRFYSNDPVTALGHLSGAQGIQGFNRYAYAINNPYKYVDPDGRVVVVASRPLDMPGGGLGSHTFTIVSTGKGSPTIFSSHNVGGKNVFSKNHPSDVSAMNAGKITDSVVIQPPEGMTSEQFDGAVLSTGEFMTTRESLDYSAIPALDGAATPNEGNCHTCTTNLITGAGGTIPESFDPQGANPDLGHTRITHDRPKEEDR